MIGISLRDYAVHLSGFAFCLLTQPKSTTASSCILLSYLGDLILPYLIF